MIRASDTLPLVASILKASFAKSGITQEQSKAITEIALVYLEVATKPSESQLVRFHKQLGM